MSQQTSERKRVNAGTSLDEMHDLVQRAAGPHAPWKVRVARAARTLGISFNRAKDFYYRDRRISVSADELNRCRAAAAKVADENEIESLRTLVAQLDSVADRLERLGVGQDAGRARRVSGRLRGIADGDR
jgi:hypothetical protein